MVLDNDRVAATRRKSQRNGEEDPVIVAQRFLNIFRQLHIFGEEKKKSFNQMLLALPPDIRGLFGSLPGGATLQEYVDELAEQQGATPSAAAAPASGQPDMVDEEVSKAKILATALAEAQIQASAKLQQAAPAAAPISPQATQTIIHSAAPSKVEMGGDFAKELGRVLAETLNKSAQDSKDDVRQMIKTLGDTQLEIVRILHEENSDRKEESQNLTKMLAGTQMKLAEMLKTAAAPAGIGEETKHLIKMLIDSQQQVMQRVTKVESMAKANDNSELIKILANSQQYFTKAVALINQTQKQGNLEIAKMINESQEHLAKVLIQHNTAVAAAANNNNANNIQINTADYSHQLTLLSDKLAEAQTLNAKTLENVLAETVKTQSKLYREAAAAQTKELSAIISLALKESQKISTDNLIKALEKLPQPQPVPVYQYVPQPEPYPQNFQPPSVFPDEATGTAQPQSVSEEPLQEMPAESYAYADMPVENSASFYPSAEEAAVYPAAVEPQGQDIPAETSEAPIEEMPKKKKKKK